MLSRRRVSEKLRKNGEKTIGIAPEEVKTTDMHCGIMSFVVVQIIGLALLVKFREIILWVPEKFIGF